MPWAWPCHGRGQGGAAVPVAMAMAAAPTRPVPVPPRLSVPSAGPGRPTPPRDTARGRRAGAQLCHPGRAGLRGAELGGAPGSWKGLARPVSLGSGGGSRSCLHWDTCLSVLSVSPFALRLLLSPGAASASLRPPASSYLPPPPHLGSHLLSPAASSPLFPPKGEWAPVLCVLHGQVQGAGRVWGREDFWPLCYCTGREVPRDSTLILTSHKLYRAHVLWCCDAEASEPHTVSVLTR